MFDMVVASLFRMQGYEAVVVDGPNDGGVDIRLWREGVLSLVQCKCKGGRYKVSSEEVRRFAADVEAHAARGALEPESAAYFVTSTEFVHEARLLSREAPAPGAPPPHLGLWVGDAGGKGLASCPSQRWRHRLVLDRTWRLHALRRRMQLAAAQARRSACATS